MIDRLSMLPVPATGAPIAPRRVLRMEQGDRTAGSIPVWEIARDTDLPLEKSESRGGLNYAENSARAGRDAKPFGFKDLLDIVNPLQHIPVVSMLYRKVTGDEIQPSSRIVGDTLYGGFAGAASGIVNVIVEKETGRDVAGNAMNLVMRGEAPRLIKRDAPELPGSVIALSDLKDGKSAYNVTPEELLWPAEIEKPVWERG